MRGRLYTPASFVLAVQTIPRSVSVAVTLAPLIGAPLGSTTVPTIAAVISWADSGARLPTIATNSRRTTAKLIDRCITEPPGSACEPFPHDRTVVTEPSGIMLYSKAAQTVKKKIMFLQN